MRRIGLAVVLTASLTVAPLREQRCTPRAKFADSGGGEAKETDMKLIKVLTWAMWSLAFTLTALPGLAADYPAPKEGSWVVRDFRFHTGEVLPELRLHYTTVGVPTEMSGRNWMMRRLIIDSIRNDAGWEERQLHQATTQPTGASVF